MNRKNLKSCDMYLQSWTKYLEQSQEIQQNWTGLQRFNIYFSVSFDCYCQSLISQRRGLLNIMSPPTFEIF